MSGATPVPGEQPLLDESFDFCKCFLKRAGWDPRGLVRCQTCGGVIEHGG